MLGEVLCARRCAKAGEPIGDGFIGGKERNGGRDIDLFGHFYGLLEQRVARRQRESPLCLVGRQGIHHVGVGGPIMVVMMGWCLQAAQGFWMVGCLHPFRAFLRMGIFGGMWVRVTAIFVRVGVAFVAMARIGLMAVRGNGFHVTMSMVAHPVGQDRMDLNTHAKPDGKGHADYRDTQPHGGSIE